jgi:ubiquinone/menaquinone biosynthesis C-methylase UbiE
MSNGITRRTIETYEKTAERYAEEHSDDIYLVKEQLDFFIASLKGNRVLDVGCGPGRDAKYLLENGLDVTGIDLTTRFIEIASEKVPGAKFIVMDMREMDLPDSTFDGIWSCGSFHHLPKKETKSTLLEFRRVLKKGGIVYISVKSGTGEKEVRKEDYDCRPRLFSFYGLDEMRRLVESCGFGVVKIYKENKDKWINLLATKI